MIDAIGRALPAPTAASWDPTGLQVGDRDAVVATIGVCHEVTEAVVDEAIGSVDLLLTYHPLLFRPTTRFVSASDATGRAFRLARAGVGVGVAHTTFDVASGGMADSLAEALGLVDVVPFGSAGPEPVKKVVTFVPGDAVETVAGAMAAAGGGVIGDYSGCSFRVEGVGAFDAGGGAVPFVGDTGRNRVTETRLEMIVPTSRLDAVTAALVTAHPYEEPAHDIVDSVSNVRFIGRIGTFPGSGADFAEIVCDRVGSAGVRVSGGPVATGARVAVVPGSGSSFIPAARSAGAIVIVTGDVDHHTTRAANDAGMTVVDPGHAPTERPGMEAFVGLVRLTAPDCRVVDLTGHDPTPWR